MEFNIWIGNRIPPMRDLNHLNLLPYLAQGSLIIESPNDRRSQDVVNATERFLLCGGTILKFDTVTGLRFGQTRPCGTQNEDSLSGEYLAGSVDFALGKVARVRYTNPNKCKSFCSRVITATGTYMITYGVKPTPETHRYINVIMDWLNASLPEGFTEPDYNPTETIQPETSTATSSTVDVPTIVNVPTRRPVAVKKSSDSTAALIGVATGLAVDAAIGIGISSLTG